MGLLDLAFAPVRAALSAAEREAAAPVRDIENIQHHVLEAAEAIRSATESIEAHIGVIDTLATSIAPLAESVNRLTAQMAELNKVLGPVASAEREVSRLEHLFGRRHHASAPDPSAGPPDATSPSG